MKKKAVIAFALALMLTATACGSSNSDEKGKKIRTNQYDWSSNLWSSGPDSYAPATTTTTTPTTTFTTTTTVTTTVPRDVPVDPHAYDDVVAYTPKNDDEKAAMEGFDVAVSVIAAHDIRGEFLHTNLREVLATVGTGGSNKLDEYISYYEMHDEACDERVSPDVLQLGKDNSYVITNMEEMPHANLPRNYLFADEEIDEMSTELYEKYGFVTEFYEMGDYGYGANLADHVEKAYYVTYVSNYGGENVENTRVMIYPEHNEFYERQDECKREWYLDVDMYASILSYIKNNAF